MECVNRLEASFGDMLNQLPSILANIPPAPAKDPIMNMDPTKPLIIN